MKKNKNIITLIVTLVVLFIPSFNTAFAQKVILLPLMIGKNLLKPSKRSANSNSS